MLLLRQQSGRLGGVPIPRRLGQCPRCSCGSGDNRTMAEILRRQELITPAGRHQRAWSGGGLSCERRLHRCEQVRTERQTDDCPTSVWDEQATAGPGDNRKIAEVARITAGSGDSRTIQSGHCPGGNKRMADIPRRQEMIMPGRHQRAWSSVGLSCEMWLHSCEQSQSRGPGRGE